MSRQAGTPIIWLGSIVVVGGMLIAFYTVHRKVWVRLESQMPLKVDRGSINQLFAEMEEEYEFIKEERNFLVDYLEEDKEIEVYKEALSCCLE